LLPRLDSDLEFPGPRTELNHAVIKETDLAEQDAAVTIKSRGKDNTSRPSVICADHHETYVRRVTRTATCYAMYRRGRTIFPVDAERISNVCRDERISGSAINEAERTKALGPKF